jgi:hypothetical protein
MDLLLVRATTEILSSDRARAAGTCMLYGIGAARSQSGLAERCELVVIMRDKIRQGDARTQLDL